MWIYVPYYRQICKKPSQVRLLDKIESTADTKEVVNKSGNTITKHKVGFWDFNKLNLGITYKIEDNDYE